MTRGGPPAGLVTATWARVLMDGLVGGGLTDVVISPGSRNTPLVLAALVDGRIGCRWVIDERSAGFLALGMARRGRLAALVCTSGTAGAHYLPALLEARQSSLPLLVLTADRPPELQRCGANQTIDQRALYASIDTWDLGPPDPSLSSLRAVRRVGAQAVARAKDGGPVHLNAPFRKPLEPAHARPEDEAWVAAVEALRAAPTPVFASSKAAPSDDAVERLEQLIDGAERGLVVAGPGPGDRAELAPLLHRVAASRGLRLYAEATSNLRRVGPAMQFLTAGDAIAWDPDLVVVFGSLPVASDWGRYRARSHAPGVLIAARAPADRGWADEHGRAELVVEAELSAVLKALEADISSTPAVLPAPEPSTVLDGPAAAATVLDSLPSPSTLMVGNSLAVRDLDAARRLVPDGVAVLSQRGVSGIDGLLAGAIGAAIGGNGPVVLLLGDVSLAHDIGSLQLRPMLGERTLVVVLLDNRGGRIFDRLPVARSGLAPEDFAFWTTPPTVDFDAVAAAHGWPISTAGDADGLACALAEALQTPGGSMIHAHLEVA